MHPHWPLSDLETRTLLRALDRIVPPDQDPGAVDAGVPTFLARLWHEHPEWIDQVRVAIQLLDSRLFTALTDDDCDAVLLELEGHPAMALMISQTLEGFYADPGNGGNKDTASWTIVGFRVTA